MKRIYLLLIACVSAMLSFAQGYPEQMLGSISDSIETNPKYVVDWADSAISKNKKCADAYFIKACVYISMQDYLKALEQLNISLKVVSNKSLIKKSQILCTRAMLYVKVEELELALADLESAIKANPKELFAYEHRISLYKDLLQYDNAEKDCRKLLSIKDSIAYKLELASILTYQEKTDEALEIVNKIIKYQPREASSYATRSWIYAVAGESQKAIYDYLQYIILDGDYDLDYLVTLSRMDYAYTINTLSQLMITNDKKNIWLGARIRVYIDNGEYEMALTDINSLKEIYKEETIFTLYQQVMCYNGLYEFSKEIEIINKLLDLQEKKEPLIVALRGEAYRNVDDLESAIRDYNEAILLSPSTAFLYSERGWTYEMQNDFDKALQDYNTSITLDAENAWVRIQRGKLLRERGNLLEANEDFEIALQLDTISNTHAFALLLLGEEQKAIEFMNAIVEKDMQDAANLYDLACIYSLADKKEEAVKTLQRAVDLGYKNFNHIKNDRDLINIREEEGYKEILDIVVKNKVLKLFDSFGS